MENLTFEEAYNILIDLGVLEQTIDTVCKINGYNLEQLENILYATHGYECFSQLYEDE